MQGNGLETDEVVARGDSGRDGGGPGGVLVNHLAITPVTVVDGTGKETGLVDLELHTPTSKGKQTWLIDIQ